MKKFAILQLRPETEAADSEYAAFLEKGGLAEEEVARFRLDEAGLPAGFDPGGYAAVIVGGGPGCISDKPAEKDPVEARIEAEMLALMGPICAADLPFLGCCYGIGILAHHLAPGSVSKARYSEPVGGVDCTLTAAGRADPLLAGLPASFRALVGHKEAVQHLPPGAVHLVSSGPAPFQMLRHGANVYATQFHPEADAAGFETRIRLYRHRGYFPPETAEALIDEVRGEEVTVPPMILARFVARYRG